MSEPAPPDIVATAAVAGPPGLNDVLADFARWYAESSASNGQPALTPPPSIDLATLLGHFIALRQEINLQTRSVRAQQEQTAEFARGVRQAVEGLAKAPRPDTEEIGDPLPPLLKALVEIYDALSLAGAQIQKTRAAALPALAEAAPEAPRAADAPRAFWQRWFLSPTAEQALKAGRDLGERQGERSAQARQAADRIAAALDGLIVGYTMSLERIDRTLRQHGLEPIAALGRAFDPEQMEALEAVANSGRPSGEVVDEVRRGYLQQGRIYRCALVRVAKD